MKKLALILLICIYSISTFGVGLRSFYCCGRLKSVTVTLPTDKKEKCGNGSENDGCCKTTYRFFKVNDKHFSPGDIPVPGKVYPSIASVIPVYEDNSFKPFQPGMIIGSHAPPRYNGLPVYLSNRVFRI